MRELYGVVLMYLDGYKVSEDDFGDLWCSEVPEEYVTPGDGVVIEGSAFIPLEDLSAEEQERIRKALAELPEEYLDVLRNYGGGEK